LPGQPPRACPFSGTVHPRVAARWQSPHVARGQHSKRGCHTALTGGWPCCRCTSRWRAPSCRWRGGGRCCCCSWWPPTPTSPGLAACQVTELPACSAAAAAAAVHPCSPHLAVLIYMLPFCCCSNKCVACVLSTSAPWLHPLLHSDPTRTCSSIMALPLQGMPATILAMWPPPASTASPLAARVQTLQAAPATRCWRWWRARE
jgi:hypothetical protein